MCKENFGAKVQTKVDAYKAPFPILLIFADGRSTLTELTLCNSIIDIGEFELPSSTSGTITGGEKLN
jgi:hypothetical protein